MKMRARGCCRRLFVIVSTIAAELTDLVLGDGTLEQLAVFDDDFVADGTSELEVRSSGSSSENTS